VANVSNSAPHQSSSRLWALSPASSCGCEPQTPPFSIDANFPEVGPLWPRCSLLRIVASTQRSWETGCALIASAASAAALAWVVFVTVERAMAMPVPLPVPPPVEGTRGFDRKAAQSVGWHLPCESAARQRPCAAVETRRLEAPHPAAEPATASSAVVAHQRSACRVWPPTTLLCWSAESDAAGDPIGREAAGQRQISRFLPSVRDTASLAAQRSAGPPTGCRCRLSRSQALLVLFLHPGLPAPGADDLPLASAPQTGTNSHATGPLATVSASRFGGALARKGATTDFHHHRRQLPYQFAPKAPPWGATPGSTHGG